MVWTLVMLFFPIYSSKWASHSILYFFLIKFTVLLKITFSWHISICNLKYFCKDLLKMFIYHYLDLNMHIWEAIDKYKPFHNDQQDAGLISSQLLWRWSSKSASFSKIVFLLISFHMLFWWYINTVLSQATKLWV